MNWKEFFKFSKEKITVFIVLILAGSSISWGRDYLWGHRVTIGGIYPPPSNLENILELLTKIFFLPLWLGGPILSLIKKHIGFSAAEFTWSLLFGFLSFVYLYTISCLIIYIVKKYKK